jgi:hypothetical protein
MRARIIPRQLRVGAYVPRHSGIGRFIECAHGNISYPSILGCQVVRVGDVQGLELPTNGNAGDGRLLRARSGPGPRCCRHRDLRCCTIKHR